MNDKQKNFVKINSEILSSIFADKISELTLQVLDENKPEFITTINILRTWLREVKMIEQGQEIKPLNFI